MDSWLAWAGHSWGLPSCSWRGGLCSAPSPASRPTRPLCIMATVITRGTMWGRADMMTIVQYWLVTWRVHGPGATGSASVGEAWTSRAHRRSVGRQRGVGRGRAGLLLGAGHGAAGVAAGPRAARGRHRAAGTLHISASRPASLVALKLENIN